MIGIALSVLAPLLLDSMHDDREASLNESSLVSPSLTARLTMHLWLSCKHRNKETGIVTEVEISVIHEKADL